MDVLPQPWFTVNKSIDYSQYNSKLPRQKHTLQILDMHSFSKGMYKHGFRVTSHLNRPFIGLKNI